MVSDSTNTPISDEFSCEANYVYYECPLCGDRSRFGIIAAAYTGGSCQGDNPKHQARAYIPSPSDKQ